MLGGLDDKISPAMVSRADQDLQRETLGREWKRRQCEVRRQRRPDDEVTLAHERRYSLRATVQQSLGEGTVIALVAFNEGHIGFRQSELLLCHDLALGPGNDARYTRSKVEV